MKFYNKIISATVCKSLGKYHVMQMCVKNHNT